MIHLAELQAIMKAEVEAAGGPKKWARKHKIYSVDHIPHMVADGRAATSPVCLEALGYDAVTMYRKKGPA